MASYLPNSHGSVTSKTGRIAYVATLPLENIADGQYEVRAIVKQDPATAAEHTYFILN